MTIALQYSNKICANFCPYNLSSAVIISDSVMSFILSDSWRIVKYLFVESIYMYMYCGFGDCVISSTVYTTQSSSQYIEEEFFLEIKVCIYYLCFNIKEGIYYLPCYYLLD